MLRSYASTAPKKLTYESLRNARHLDSFIREVLRLKGDTLSNTRQTIEDVPKSKSVQKQSYANRNILRPDTGDLVIPLATLSHRSREFHGEGAAVFKGFRWVENGPPASIVRLLFIRLEPLGVSRSRPCSYR